MREAAGSLRARGPTREEHEAWTPKAPTNAVGLGRPGQRHWWLLSPGILRANFVISQTPTSQTLPTFTARAMPNEEGTITVRKE